MITPKSYLPRKDYSDGSSSICCEFYPVQLEQTPKY